MSDQGRGGFLSTIGLVDDPDRVIIGKSTVVEQTTPQTGIDRLKRMFTLDQYGYQSKEVVFITQTAYATFFGGGFFGAIMQSRNAFINFMENNQATKFQNHLDAKRELQRVMYLAFGKGAWTWGKRVGFFSVSFVSLATMVSVYRGKESPVEYIVAGGLTGAMFRMSLGPKGAIAGCLAGSVLGGITGAASLLVLKIAGFTMDDMRGFAKDLKDIRAEAIRKKAADTKMSKDEELSAKKDLDDSLLENLETVSEEKKLDE